MASLADFRMLLWLPRISARAMQARDVARKVRQVPVPALHAHTHATHKWAQQRADAAEQPTDNSDNSDAEERAGATPSVQRASDTNQQGVQVKTG